MVSEGREPDSETDDLLIALARKSVTEDVALSFAYLFSVTEVVSSFLFSSYYLLRAIQPQLVAHPLRITRLANWRPFLIYWSKQP